MKYKTERLQFEVTSQKNNNAKSERQDELKWRNSLVSLHKVLNNLQNENLRRYNDEQNRRSLQDLSKTNYKTQKINLKKRNNNDTELPYKFTIEPEPWYNDNEATRLKRERNVSQVSKSFHLTLPKHLQTQKFNYRHNRSSSTIDPSNMNTIRDGDYEKLRKLKQNLTQKDKFITQNFNYTNEQKAKVSIIHLAHQKQHKKIEKILKYKAHFIDKTGLKQQKINQHSKFIIEALKSLQFDGLIPNKKKSSLKIQGNKRMRTLSSIGKSQINEMKSISCGKLETLNQTVSKIHYNPDQVRYSIKKLEPEIIKIEQPIKDKQNYKVKFKPKRNWIFQNKSTSQKNLKENSQTQTQKYLSKVQQISSHFLKINKLGQ